MRKLNLQGSANNESHTRSTSGNDNLRLWWLSKGSLQPIISQGKLCEWSSIIVYQKLDVKDCLKLWFEILKCATKLHQHVCNNVNLQIQIIHCWVYQNRMSIKQIRKHTWQRKLLRQKQSDPSERVKLRLKFLLVQFQVERHVLLF